MVIKRSLLLISLVALLASTDSYSFAAQHRRSASRRSRPASVLSASSKSTSQAKQTTTKNKEGSFWGLKKTPRSDSQHGLRKKKDTKKEDKRLKKHFAQGLELLDQQKAQDSIEQRRSQRFGSLNAVMHHHYFLTGVNIGYRLDKSSAIELTIPVGGFSPFYMLTSISYKYNLYRSSQWHCFGKVGVGVPFARLKLQNNKTFLENWKATGQTANPEDIAFENGRALTRSNKKKSSTRFQKEVEEPVICEEKAIVSTWKWDVVLPMMQLYVTHPTFISPNVFIISSLCLMRPATHEGNATSLFSGLIGSGQFGLLVKLG